MIYLLDTNTCIQYINGRSEAIARRLQKTQSGDVMLCSVVIAELLFGAWGSQQPHETLEKQRRFIALFASLPFDDRAAEHYARIRADLKSKGTPIGGNDVMIAAIAMAHHLILVTHNTQEFQRVAGLRIDDWE